MKFIVLVLFSLSVAEIEEEVPDLNILWDENLLNFRWKIFETEGRALKKIDEIFYDAYNQISNRYIEPFIKMRKEWIFNCKAFSTDNIKETITFNTMRKLLNFCDSIEYFLERVPKYAKDYLTQIYNGGILTENLLEINSMSLNIYAIERFEFLLPMYHHNPSCAVLTFPKLIEIFENFTANIEQIHEEYKNIMPRSESEYEGKLQTTIRLVKKAQVNFNACSEAFNKTKCFEPILDIKCFALKPCSIQFHLLRLMSEFYRTFNSNKNMHSNLIHARYDKVLELSSNFSDILIDWENDVEKCLVDE